MSYINHLVRLRSAENVSVAGATIGRKANLSTDAAGSGTEVVGTFLPTYVRHPEIDYA